MTSWKDLFGATGNFTYTEFEKYFGEMIAIINDLLCLISMDKRTFPVYMSDGDYVFEESLLGYNVDMKTREMIKRLITYRNELAEMDREFGDIRKKSVSAKIYNEMQETLNNLNEMFELPD